MKIEISGGADHYGNVCKTFSMVSSNDLWEERIVIMSGSDGISIATKSPNNSHVRLGAKDIVTLCLELLKSVDFSRKAKNDCAEIWAAKNNAYDQLKEIQKRYKIDSDGENK